MSRPTRWVSSPSQPSLPSFPTTERATSTTQIRSNTMTKPIAAPASITTVASFPEHFFLENLAVRADGSILVTVLNHKQLWYVPAPDGGRPVTPALVHTFDDFA